MIIVRKTLIPIAVIVVLGGIAAIAYYVFCQLKTML